MGLMSMIGDVVGTLHDMKSLTKQQEEITKGIEGLISSGKCPEPLKQAFDAVKNVSKDAKLEDSMGTLKNFVKALQDHESALPEDMKGHIDKFAEVVKDLEEKSADITKQTKTDK